MTVYKLIYDDGNEYEPYREDMAYFSTREKAEELRNQFQKYDYLSPHAYDIEECEVDVIPDYVLKELEGYKESYDEYYNNEEESQ